MITKSNPDQCCGCTACATICPKQCISMLEDDEGFLYPHVDETTCIDCGLCEKVCPEMNPYEPTKPKFVYAAINPSDAIRMKSSSGGIFTMLAEKVINAKGVVFGAAFDDKWEVHHVRVDSIPGLSTLRGSKYVQSRIDNTFREAEIDLKNGRQVLFSGTSCQIAGLKHYLRKEFDNLLTVDLICHGAPSPLVWRDYVKYIRRQKADGDGKNAVWSSLNEAPSIEGISFRDKSESWKKCGLVFRFRRAEGTTEKFSPSSVNAEEETDICYYDRQHSNLFMQGFAYNFFLRPSCYKCRAKCGTSHSDITLADFWGIEKYMPDIDNEKGVSLVMVNSSRGQNVWDTLEVIKYESTYSKALPGNFSIEHSVAVPPLRHVFWELYKTENVAAIATVLKMMEPKGLKKIAIKVIDFLRKTFKK